MAIMRLHIATFISFVCLISSVFSALSMVTPQATRTKILNLLSTDYTSSNATLSYNYVFSSALPINAVYFGMGIAGFQSYITTDLSMNLSYTGFTQSSVQIFFSVAGNTHLYYFGLWAIAVGQPDNHFLQVLLYCYLCNNLNQNTGTRTETRTQTSTFTGYSLTSVVVLSGFKLHNSNGIIDYLKVQVSNSVGSPTLNYVFTTVENNTVESICVTTIVWNQLVIQNEGYLDVGSVGSVILDNTTLPQSTLTIPSYNRPFDTVFYGISEFNMSRGFNRVFGFKYPDQNNLDNGYQTNVGTFKILYSYLRINSRTCDAPGEQYNATDNTCNPPNYCTTGNQFLATPGDYCTPCHYSCSTCNAFGSNGCQTCDATVFRQLPTGGTSCPCQSGFLDVGVTTCYACNLYISGCIQCTAVDICNQCQANMNLYSPTQCTCTTGYLVSGICVPYPGCLSAISYSSNIYCLNCDSSLNLTRSSTYTCQCIDGYSYSGSTCIFQCGDGVRVTGQQCDDGNLQNGDGCSNVCKIQANWTCDITVDPSLCTQIVEVSMKLKYVVRQIGSNKMKIAIQLSPSNAKYSTLSFSSMVTHNVPSTSTTYKFNNDVLEVQFSYSKSIEGKDYQLQLNLDPTVFSSSTVSLAIPATGMNAKLTYDEYYGHNPILEIVVYVFCGIALLLFVLSVISQRMIGVETIQTIQSVLYLMLLMENCPASLSTLQFLRYTNGYNFISGDDNSRTFTYNFRFSAIGIEKQFLLSYNFMYILLVISLLSVIIVKIVHKVLENKSQDAELTKKRQQNYQKKANRANFICQFLLSRIFFLLAMISIFIVLVGLVIELSTMQPLYTSLPKQFNLISALIAAVLILGINSLICMAYTLPVTSKWLSFDFESKFYLPWYIFYQTVFIMLISIFYYTVVMFYICWVIMVVNCIVLGIIRPYKLMFHNVIIILHQIFLILVLACYYFANYNSQNDNYEIIYLIMTYVIIATLFLIIFISAIRLFLTRKYFCLADNISDAEMNHNYFEKKQDTPKIGILNKYFKREDKILNTNDQLLKKSSLLQSKVRPIEESNSNKLKNQNNDNFDTSMVKRSSQKRANDNQLRINVNQSPKNQSLMRVRDKINYIDEQGLQDDDPLKRIKKRLRKDLVNKSQLDII